ncbi:unnamed protein product, partial [Ceratitis capitata]
MRNNNNNNSSNKRHNNNECRGAAPTKVTAIKCVESEQWRQSIVHKSSHAAAEPNSCVSAALLTEGGSEG